MMTRKQINSLRRKARMGAVIGAAIYLAVGVTSFGKDNSSIEASATPTQQPVSIPQETSQATVQEERIIIHIRYSRCLRQLSACQNSNG